MRKNTRLCFWRTESASNFVNLNQITLPVRDMSKAVDFYITLGFTQIVDTPHYSRFECPIGESSFSLALDYGNFNNGATIYFEHPQLDEWVEKLISEGLEFAQLPKDEKYLWREAILYDPSENKIKLYWAGENRLYPPWRTTSRDH